MNNISKLWHIEQMWMRNMKILKKFQQKVDENRKKVIMMGWLNGMLGKMRKRIEFTIEEKCRNNDEGIKECCMENGNFYFNKSHHYKK